MIKMYLLFVASAFIVYFVFYDRSRLRGELNNIKEADNKVMSQAKINDGGERTSYGDGMAVREPSAGKGRYDLISPFATRRLAEWYELGAQKYSPRNWEKGMPFSRYIDSAKRHLDKFIMGMNDEDHLAAAAWNIFAIMHHQELGQTEFDDMPHYESSEPRQEIDGQMTLDNYGEKNESLENPV